jgi:hypothetical protein
VPLPHSSEQKHTGKILILDVESKNCKHNKCRFLIDTGSSVSLISREILRGIIDITNIGNVKFIGITGDELKIIRKVILPLKVDNIKISLNYRV